MIQTMSLFLINISSVDEVKSFTKFSIAKRAMGGTGPPQTCPCCCESTSLDQFITILEMGKPEGRRAMINIHVPALGVGGC